MLAYWIFGLSVSGARKQARKEGRKEASRQASKKARHREKLVNRTLPYMFCFLFMRIAKNRCLKKLKNYLSYIILPYPNLTKVYQSSFHHALLLWPRPFAPLAREIVRVSQKLTGLARTCHVRTGGVNSSGSGPCNAQSAAPAKGTTGHATCCK